MCDACLVHIEVVAGSLYGRQPRSGPSDGGRGRSDGGAAPSFQEQVCRRAAGGFALLAGRYGGLFAGCRSRSNRQLRGAARVAPGPVAGSGTASSRGKIEGVSIVAADVERHRTARWRRARARARRDEGASACSRHGGRSYGKGARSRIAEGVMARRARREALQFSVFSGEQT